MIETKLGRLAKKTIKIDNEGNIRIDSLTFGKGDYTIEDIIKVYVAKPAFMQDGNLYLSTTGNNVTGDPQLQVTGFAYTKKQQNDVDEIISFLGELNPELDIEGFDITDKLVKSQTKKKIDKNAVTCPKCKSTNAVFMDNKKKSFSMGKAVVGTALTGGVGALAGFAGKKGKDRWHCQDCGNTFETKS